jgi:hypothetical protein
MIRKCDVCELINKDATPKEVTWCEPCKRWKCAKCMGSIVRSAKGFVLDKIGRLVSM